MEVGFLQILQFPQEILIPQSAPYSLIILSLMICNTDADSVVE
jgi:hypothetical protein